MSDGVIDWPQDEELQRIAKLRVVWLPDQAAVQLRCPCGAIVSKWYPSVVSVVYCLNNHAEGCPSAQAADAAMRQELEFLEHG